MVEKIYFSLRPHLVETVLVLVHSVGCFVFEEDVVESSASDVRAFGDDLLGLGKFVFFHFPKGLVVIILADEGLNG